MMKNKRLEVIKNILITREVETQEELVHMLCTEGYEVTQATVSRDIKELGLVKALSSSGKYFYSLPETKHDDFHDRFSSIFSHSVLSITSAGNLIVIKTVPASASAAAEAIDSLKWPEIVGTIAGDNTIFLAVHDSKSVQDLIKRFQKMM